MSRNLTTQDQMQNKWTPSPELSITEEEEEDDVVEAEEEEGSDYTSSSSIPDENINFDLVYTLHTFEATVDGQASVKKGDTLTLLNDSNSYWWLIRDLKTSEVGYIPAENIEMPFERLARLNKHRNVELTSLEQAAHYINKVSQKPENNQKKKKVILSTSLDIQLQILLHGENEDEIEEEEYEEWVEEMTNDEEDTDTEDEVASIEVEDNLLIEEPPVNNHHTQLIPVNSKVIRVFAGNVDVGASYHSIRVTESTSVNELLSSTLEKFHISEIETKHGRSYGKSSGVEYYLTVETRDGDEIILDSEDKPYAIYESLTAHLTTPMPSLAQFQQFTSTADYNFSKKKKKRTSTMYDSAVQFCLHKRIKRVIDKSGKVHIKVSLKTPVTPAEKTIKASSLFRFGSKNKKENAEMERIDKLIATPTNIIVSELTSLALVKFHIISDTYQPHQYRLILHSNGKDTLLSENLKLSDVLLKVKNKEKHFILHNFANKSETTTSSSSNTKVFPEKRTDQQMLNLKRIDTAPQTQRSISDFNVKTHTSQFPNRNALPHNKNSVSGGDEVATMASHFSSKKPATQLSKPDIVVEKETEKSFSSLADLEKELHRIITSHTC